jgi:phospholipid/cholesterol/gamma-HCH transport system ATP-binding protein
MMGETLLQNTGKEVVISLKNVEKSFDSNKVLKGISIDIQRGENFAILGRSGSGKSVLIKIISGLLKPDSGSVNVLGKEVDKLNESALQELRLKIGFSFQSSALYDSMSVKENLAFPIIRNKHNLSKKEISTAIESVLHDVGLSQTINQMTTELSGGQRKRIGIARTLIMKPEIMLYDEPTSGLDPMTCVEINTLINKVQKEYKASSIIITHDLTCAKTTANRVTMIIDGKFLKPGLFTDIFTATNPETQSFFNYNFINEK